jgi:hypothetical protein
MTGFLNFLVAHWGYISAAILLALKWGYNSWTPGVSFLQFVHNYIGEIIQESPESTVARQQQEGQKLQKLEVDNGHHE